MSHRAVGVLSVCAAAAIAAFASPDAQPSPRRFVLDHVWIAVEPGAPERRLLEALGFHVVPNVNRHDGQGTASITFEFENAFLELIWADSSVAVTPGLEVVARKFRARSAWRTSGWSPYGFALRRVPGAPDSLPFPTWEARAEWMQPGSAMQVLTPRADSTSPSVFVIDRTVSIPDSWRVHAAGVARLTGVRVLAPRAFVTTETFQTFSGLGVAETDRGLEWLLELTFDGGRQRKSADLRPGLPLVLHC